MDDIKCGASDHVTSEFLSALESVFGKGEIDVTKVDFTCCGVRHSRRPDGSYEMDQIEFISALRCIRSAATTGRRPEEMAPPDVAKQFISLLMALAFALLTRVDLHVYVIALQRFAQAPQIIHVKRLNALVLWAQRNPLALTYKPMSCARRLEMHSDAACRKEEKEGVDQGRAMRGATYLRIGGSTPSALTGIRPCHLLNWNCGSLKTVTD